MGLEFWAREIANNDEQLEEEGLMAMEEEKSMDERERDREREQREDLEMRKGEREKVC